MGSEMGKNFIVVILLLVPFQRLSRLVAGSAFLECPPPIFLDQMPEGATAPILKYRSDTEPLPHGVVA